MDDKKLPLQVDGDFIPAKTSKIFRIPAAGDDKDVLIIDQDTVPDEIYKIKNGIIKVPIQNHSTKPAEIPKRIKYEEIYTMCSLDVNFPKRDESWQRLQEILKLSKLEHLEPEQKEFIEKIIRKYQEVF